MIEEEDPNPQRNSLLASHMPHFLAHIHFKGVSSSALLTVCLKNIVVRTKVQTRDVMSRLPGAKQNDSRIGSFYYKYLVCFFSFN